MNNPENSEMNNEQKQINFELELNGIIPNSNNPSELNVGNENAGHNGSIVEETLTCLEDFDEILEYICKQNEPTSINTQCGIAIKGESLNDLNTSGEVNTSTKDNFKNWQKMYEDFIKGAELKAVEYNNNYEEGRNNENSKILIASIESFNKNNNLETWNAIYENFLAETNAIVAGNGEDSLMMSKVDIELDSAILNITENDKKESSSRKTRGNHFKMNTTNRNIIACNNKNTVTETNLNKKIASTINKNDFIKTSSAKNAIEIVECDIAFNRQPTDTNTLKECFNINKNPTNTNEFEDMEVGIDSDGYNSSDFEFINEDEAINAPNFKWLSGEFNYGEATTKNKLNFENDTAIPTTSDSPNFDNIYSENGQLSLSKVKSVLGVNDHQRSVSYTEIDEEDNIVYDYFKSLESTLNTNEFDTSYIDNHRIPNDEEYLYLFGGNHTPYATNPFFENKATPFSARMTVNFDGDFAMHASMKCESTSEQRAEAKETSEKILSMYSRENFGYNLRRTR